MKPLWITLSGSALEPFDASGMVIGFVDPDSNSILHRLPHVKLIFLIVFLLSHGCDLSTPNQKRGKHTNMTVFYMVLNCRRNFYGTEFE